LFVEGDFKNPWPVFLGVGSRLLLLAAFRCGGIRVSSSLSGGQTGSSLDQVNRNCSDVRFWL
jgi:hypothetical protein